MASFLNQNNRTFLDYYDSKIYVDKSLLIEKVNECLNTSDKFMCVTRPRRFGKTLALSMLNAYYSKGSNSKDIFDKLAISKSPSYLNHLNKHNVIWIDVAEIYLKVKDKNNFIDKLKEYILDDLIEAYPNLDIKNDLLEDAIIKINSVLNERFIFLFDEWDVIFRDDKSNSLLCDDYIDLLRSLFKSTRIGACIDLVYMTGILPIKRYSTQSTLNMFREYNMISPKGLESFLGFTESEVKSLCLEYYRNFKDIKEWYDGYKLKGLEIYNPKSVVEAILTNELGSHWALTSAMESVTKYMNYDHGELKDIITLMLTGEKIKIDPTLFENDLTKVDSKDAALTVLIHLGYLAYDEVTKKCYIPNQEISLEFEKALKKLKWVELDDPISNSLTMLEETLKFNTAYINETLDKNHKELASIFNKNKEDILGVVVYMSYYQAKNYYDIKKEDSSILGRADLTFIPKDNNHIPLIIELKVDTSSEDAIKQIKEKEYINSLNNYKGEVLLIGINYNSKTLKHSSKIEKITL